MRDLYLRDFTLKLNQLGVINKMSKAQICPVCRGKGKYGPREIIAINENEGYKENDCYGCGGTGWVTVPD